MVLWGDKVIEDSYTFRSLNAYLHQVFGGTPRHISTEVIFDLWWWLRLLQSSFTRATDQEKCKVRVVCKDTVRFFGHDWSLGELVAHFSECQTLPSVLCRAVLFPFLCTACCMVRSCQSCGCVPSFATPDWVTPTADADIIKCSAAVPGFCPLMASVFGGRTLSRMPQASDCVAQGGGSVV